MRLAYYILFAFLFAWNVGQAQDYEFYIDYPVETTWDCPPVCIEFELVMDSFNVYQDVAVNVSPNSGTTVEPLQDNWYRVCMNFSGTYIITASATAIGPNGNIDSLTSMIYVFIEGGDPLQGAISGPTCDSSLDNRCLEACEYSTHTYFFSGSSNEIVWSVYGAESYTEYGSSIEVTWGAAGSGRLYVESLTSQCSEGIEQCIDILPTPVAEFETVPMPSSGLLQVCTGQPIYFTNLSQDAAYYEWTFGDGGTSTLFEPEHAYQTPGNYTITLNAENHCDGCMSSYSIEVEVLPAAAPELSCLATICPGERVRYDAITDGCQTFYWSVTGNGTIISGGATTDDFIEVEWNQGPEGYIELLVEDCTGAYCDKPTQFRVPIISPDGPVSGDERVCSGEISSYTIPNFPGVTYTWNVTNRGTIVAGQNTNTVSIKWDNVFSTVTNQRVSVDYGHCYLGCSGSDFIDVHIVPHLNINSEPTFCEGSDASFTSETGFFGQNPISSNWTLLDEAENELWTSPSPDATVVISMTYPPGRYFIRASANDPDAVCEDYVEKEILITPTPPVPLGIEGDSLICTGVSYAFKVEAAGDYRTEWTITDGSTMTNYSGSIINHVFNSNGPYIVEASHADLVYGCLSDAVSKTLQGSWTAAIYGPDETCSEEYTYFNVYDMPGASIEWRVEPADIAEIKDKNSTNPEIFWTGDGAAQVILSTCNQDIVHAITVHPLPSPTVTTPAGLCENETAMITTDIVYDSYIWRDEDYNFLTDDAVAELGPGYYSVEVVDQNGCSNSETFHIPFFPSPIARISTGANTGVCDVVPPTRLTANTDIGYSYQWYHDGNPVGSDSEFYIADDFGDYYVIITNAYGCSQQSNVINIFNYCGPTGGGVCNGQCCNSYPCLEYGNLGYAIDEISCSARSYTSVSLSGYPIMPMSQIWDIENANGSYTRYLGDPADHEYGAPGIYTVVLLAKLQGFPYTDDNCYHIYAFKDTVEAVADFRFTEGCVGTNTEFFDISTYMPGITITDWAWDFGDGNTSTDENPNHVYMTDGSFDVVLTVTTDAGCSSSKTYTLEVHAPPTLTIDAVTETCENNPTKFTVMSSESLFDISWNFDDPTSSNNDAVSKSPSHTFENAGTYMPEVVAANVYGCVGSTNTSIDVVANTLAGDITSTNGTALCEGETTDLISPAGGVKWDWSTDETTEQITTGTAGNYELTLEDEHQCQYTPDPIFIEVNPKPTVTINGREIANGETGFWQDTVETCEGVDIELRAFASTQVTYAWSTSATSQSIFFTKSNGGLLDPGTYRYSVTVRDIVTNCESDPVEIVVIVHDNPDDFTISLASGSGCSDTDNILQIDNPQAGVTYTWSDGQVGTQITAENSGTYTAYATNMNGCENVSTNVVVIRSSPRVDLFPSGCLVRCNPDTICIPSIPDVAYYEILRNDTLIYSGPNVPTELVATVSGDYTLYIESTNGCTATSEVLSLQLYPGYGDIDVTVYVDVNGNGIIDAADTTISGVTVNLTEATVNYGSDVTNTVGQAYYLNTPEGSYIASIDTMGLPDGLAPIIDNVVVDLMGCDVEASAELLIGTCTIYEDVMVAICPGDPVVLGDTTIYPTGDFVYNDWGVSGECDTVFTVTVESAVEGYAKINVFFDADTNGIISPADTLTGGLDIIITDLSDNSTVIVTTDAMGMFIYRDTAGDYSAAIDLSTLPPAFEILLSTVFFTIDQCDTTECDLLIAPSCFSSTSNTTVELCTGDSVLIDGTYYYGEQTVTVIYPNGECDSTVNFIIEIKDPMTFTINQTDVCEGETNGTVAVEVAGGSGSSSITWDHSASTAFELTDLAPGTYSYTITDGSCPVNGDVTIGEYIFPAIELTETDPSCPNSTDGSIVVSLASPELQWSLDSLTYTTEDFVDLEAGIYTVYFSNGNCYQSEVIELEEKDIEPFEIQQIWDVPINVPVELTHNYLDSLTHEFWWSASQFLDCTNCPTPIFNGANELVDITVTVTDPDGCIQEAELQMRVDLSPHIYIPNAFSPNGDDVNDRIKPYVREGVVRTDKFEIFDRWGNKVYSEEFDETIGDIQGWDGSRHGDMHAPGLFIYRADFSYINGETVSKYGEVHLVR